MDGFDKLKPYGFPIHGCIDGFSRKLLWLEVSCYCHFVSFRDKGQRVSLNNHVPETHSKELSIVCEGA